MYLRDYLSNFTVHLSLLLPIRTLLSTNLSLLLLKVSVLLKQK